MTKCCGGIILILLSLVGVLLQKRVCYLITYDFLLFCLRNCCLQYCVSTDCTEVSPAMWHPLCWYWISSLPAFSKVKTLFYSFINKHWIIYVSAITTLATMLLNPLAGSLFEIKQTPNLQCEKSASPWLISRADLDFQWQASPVHVV